MTSSPPNEIPADITMITSADGTKIACRFLEGTGNLVIALHGYTGDGTTMAHLVEHVRDGRPAVLVDLIGHGHSSAPEHLEHYAMASVVDQVLSIIGPHEPGTVHLIGYSLGGRVALSMAARAPWYFASVTALSATAGIEEPDERARRHTADLDLADRIEAIGVDRFVAEWLDLALFEPYIDHLDDSGFARTVEQRAAATVTGLANSLRGTGTGSMPPLWAVTPSIRSPLLAVAGSLDEKYVELANRLAATAPTGRSVIIEGAGHVVHVEKFAEVSAVVARFLSECDADADHER